MIRNFIIAVGIITTIGMINTTPANADMCDNHGVGIGQIYKTACGATSGTGGGGPTIHYVDSKGQHHTVSADDYRAVLKKNHDN